ncbi:hypothetical protein [Phormidesmis sp. 146-33]
MKSKVVYLSLLWLVALIVSSRASGSDVLIRLRELPSNSPIDAKVTVEKAGLSKVANRRNIGEYYLSDFLKREEVETYELKILPKDSLYSSRSIPLRNAEKIKEIRQFYLISRNRFGSESIDKYLLDGLRYFDRADFDAALTYYEALFSKKDTNELSDEQRLKLYYNYGRALYKTCIDKKYEYNNCERAINIYQELINLQERNKESSKKLRIDKIELTSNINELRKKGFILKYEKISKLFGEAKYTESANLSVSALKDRSSFPVLLDSLGLTEDQLFKNAGVSFQKAYEEAASRGASQDRLIDLLKSALSYLNRISVKDADTRRNIEFIMFKLRIAN